MCNANNLELNATRMLFQGYLTNPINVLFFIVFENSIDEFSQLEKECFKKINKNFGIKLKKFPRNLLISFE